MVPKVTYSEAKHRLDSLYAPLFSARFPPNCPGKHKLTYARGVICDNYPISRRIALDEYAASEHCRNMRPGILHILEWG